MARITFGIMKTQNYVYLTIAIVHPIAEYSYSVEFRHKSYFKFEFVQEYFIPETPKFINNLALARIIPRDDEPSFIMQNWIVFGRFESSDSFEKRKSRRSAGLQIELKVTKSEDNNKNDNSLNPNRENVVIEKNKYLFAQFLIFHTL
ncbi:hypothetical protein Glove_19g283 [Diversispora epigaea]|uniref:Uncharacterized protein n=1 Tax=Diversispora epigaea TaxID=1348612 RepID=A0A397JMW5_9GLOM|nr:hypothetical protein Glove_19g283 [Diversispora epigaea]